MMPDQAELLRKLIMLENVVTDLEPLLVKNAHWIGTEYLERFRAAAARLADSCEGAKAHTSF